MGKTILIGDSYGEGYSPDGNVTSWINLIQAYFPTETFLTSAVGGSGFVNGFTFLQQLQQINVQNTSDVTKIVIGGGYNDQFYDTTAIENAIREFANYTKNKFPNAKIHLLTLGWGEDVHSRTNIFNTVFQAYANASGRGGIAYFQNCCYVLHDYTCLSSDGFHPNQKGQERLANAVASYLCNGNFDYTEKWRVIPFCANPDFGMPECDFIGASVSHGQMSIDIMPCQFVLHSGALKGGEWIKIGSLSEDILAGYNLTTAFCQADVPSWCMDVTGKFYAINCKLAINADDFGVYMMITSIAPDKTRYFTMSNATILRFMGTHTMLPLFLC